MENLAPTKFAALLREAFNEPEKDITTFFEYHFLQPLNTQLDSDEKTPAETIRHKRQQTAKIKTLLIQLAKKTS
jgi:hypothetical protein